MKKEEIKKAKSFEELLNIKYGKNWRVQDIKYNDFPSIYDDHQFGEHWMD